MRKIVLIVVILVCLMVGAFVVAYSCKNKQPTLPSDETSPTEVISETTTNEVAGDDTLKVKEMLSDSISCSILESVGVEEIKEAIIESRRSQGGYNIRIVDINDNVYCIYCTKEGIIREIYKDSWDGECLWFARR